MTAAEVGARCDPRARRSGGGWLARCPAHADRTPSLSIRDGRDGRVLLTCHAGCAAAAVLAAAGLAWRDVCGDSSPRTRAEMLRLERERDAREAAEAAARRQTVALDQTADALRDRAGRIAARLAALEIAGAAPAYPGEADTLAADYHAALAAERGLCA